jgi:hypothetical protein
MSMITGTKSQTHGTIGRGSTSRQMKCHAVALDDSLLTATSWIISTVFGCVLIGLCMFYLLIGVFITTLLSEVQHGLCTLRGWLWTSR